MIKSIAIIAAAVTGLVAIPQTAEAGHSRAGYLYQSGHASCGCPVYTNRFLVRYDCYRRPVYRHVRVPLVHRRQFHRVAVAPRYRHPVHYRHNNYYSQRQYHRPAPRRTYQHTSQSGYRYGCR